MSVLGTYMIKRIVVYVGSGPERLSSQLEVYKAPYINFTLIPTAVQREQCELPADAMREPAQELGWFQYCTSVNRDQDRVVIGTEQKHTLYRT